MGDAGKRVVEDISKQDVWSPAIGKPVERISLHVEQPQQKTVGVSFHFPAFNVHIMNLGDELFVFNDDPDDVFEGEIISIESIE
jgi:hypothetical protein